MKRRWPWPDCTTRARGAKWPSRLTDSRQTHYQPLPQAGFLSPLSTRLPLLLLRQLRQLAGGLIGARPCIPIEMSQPVLRNQFHPPTAGRSKTGKPEPGTPTLPAGVSRLGLIEDAIGWPSLVAPRADVVVGAMARPALRPRTNVRCYPGRRPRWIELAKGAFGMLLIRLRLTRFIGSDIAILGGPHPQHLARVSSKERIDSCRAG
jgi:hypothetical protein